MSNQAHGLSTRRRWLRAQRHRAALVVSGPRDWALEQAGQLVVGAGDAVLWVGEQCPGAGVTQCRGDQAHQWLGRELDLVVWDSHSGTHPAGLAAISGALVGGGVLVWLVPPLEDWAWHEDGDYERLRRHRPPYFFLERFGRLLEGIAFPHELITPEAPLLKDIDPVSSGHIPLPEGPTKDQERAVAGVEAMARAPHPRPLVLRADRGRGKSSALGMAVSRLLKAGGVRIAVTAPRPAALESFWRFAGNHEPVLYLPPDEMLRRPCDWDLLLVDEAAALPVPVLLQLLEQCPRAVFATTVHGYEGSGRGFDLRFRQLLDERHPGWQLLRLTEPVRWAPDDPLEALVSQLLCLDADPADEPGSDSGVVIEQIDRSTLAREESLLRQVMGLLVSAHYQTSPDDLRQLLDDPDSLLWVARSAGQVVGVNWVLLEGGLDAELAEAVWLGRRRPRGHLMAQSLAFHGGDPEAARCRYARITRIAVHPRWRCRGVASRLIATARSALTGDLADVLGVSFGVTSDLLPFWRRQGFGLLRLGLRRDPASGTHAAMLGLALTERGAALCREQSERFALHWDMLEPEFEALPCALLGQLRQMLPIPAEESENERLTEADWRELQAFARGHRGLELSRLPLLRLAERAPETWPVADRELWGLAVIAGLSFTELRAKGLVQGRRDALQRLRRLTALLMERVNSRRRGGM